MQPRFMVAILVKPERLVRRPRYVGFFGYFTPNIILAEPQQIPSLSVISRGMPIWSQWK